MGRTGASAGVSMRVSSLMLLDHDCLATVVHLLFCVGLKLATCCGMRTVPSLYSTQHSKAVVLTGTIGDYKNVNVKCCLQPIFLDLKNMLLL